MSTVLPPFANSPTYTVAQTYWNLYPGIRAATAALSAEGSATNRVDAGVQGFAQGLGFKMFNTYFDRFLVQFYEKHPGFAETAHTHPVLVGLPVALVGSIGGSFLGSLYSGIWNRFKSPAITLMDKVFGHSKVQKAANTLRLPQLANLLNGRITKSAVGIGSLVFFVALAGKLLLDSVKFARQYKEARRQDPNSTPYALRQQVLTGSQPPLGVPDFNPFATHQPHQQQQPFQAVA